MKRKHIGILSGCLVGAVIGLVFAKAGFTFSWFTQDNNIPQDLTAQSVASYFGGGKGTEAEPYLIKGPRHFYNLAWLQYLGEFNKQSETLDENGRKVLKQYYFQLDNDIDMNGYVLPPIGTTLNPFIGSFDGNNHVVENLTVSDDYSKMTKHPVKAADHVTGDVLNDCEIIGTFGVVGLYDTQISQYSISNQINAVTNLYLDNVEIVSKRKKVLVGIICGYSGGSITYCGAHYCKLNLQKNTSNLDKFDKISKYTLIGDYDNTRVSGKGDFGYGSSLDLKKLNEMLSGYTENKEKPFVDKNGTTIIPKEYAIPLFADETSNKATYNYQQLTIKSPNWKWDGIGVLSSIDVTQAHSWKANNDNIGYYVGADCKIEKKTLSKFKDSSSDLSFYDPKTLAKLSSVPSDIKDYLIEQGGVNGDLYAMRLSGEQGQLHTKTDDVNYIDEGTIQGASQDIVVPTRCIWIAPRYAGKFQFVFYCSKKGGISFALKKIKRMGSNMYSYENGFDIDDYNSSNNKNLLDFDLKNIEENKLYYFTYDVTQEEIINGYEYVLSYTGSGDFPRFVYMDVGQSGGGQKVNVIEKVDFIKADGTGYTKTTDTGFKFSNVTFEISFTPPKNKEDTYIFFFRRNSDDSTGVLFFVNRSEESQLPGYITKKGSGNYGYAISLECNARDSFIQ